MPGNQDQLSEWVSVSEAARLLGVSRYVILRRIRSGEVQGAVRIFSGKKPIFRLPRDEVVRHRHPVASGSGDRP